MQPRKGPKKLQLKLETLQQVTSGTAPSGESFSCPGCTVLSTCSPDCNTDVTAER